MSKLKKLEYINIKFENGKRKIYLNTNKIPTKNTIDSAKTSNKEYASSCTHNINNKYKNKYNNYKENVPYWMEHPEVCKSSLASPEEIEEMEKFANIEPMLDITTKHNIDQSIYSDATILPTGTVRFAANTIVENIIGFSNGDCWVQDVSSALCVKCLSNLAGKRVLDLCAAPGGKTAQLLDMGALVTAVDISESRLNRLKENIDRLKLGDNLKIICSDVLDLQSDEKFDVVLLDAPCSATGTFRRHPEIIHTKSLNDVKKLATLQEKLLNKASSFVKPNGILLYSTCSLSKEEGERRIRQFVKNNNYEIYPINLSGADTSITKDGFIRVLPQHFDEFLGADGFFIASLQRKN